MAESADPTVRTALITGASRPEGLGFATARGLAEQGFVVFLTARDGSVAERAAEVLRKDGHRATGLGLDLGDPAGVRTTADELSRSVGRLDVLVNNAAAVPDFATLTALDADVDEVRSSLEIDLLGPWALVQALLPLLQAAPAARIVNVSSMVSQQIDRGLDLGAPFRSPAHAMGKYTLDALTRILARAFADTPILVNAVDPGSMDTHPENGVDPEDRPVAESAAELVRLATLPADGPSGQRFDQDHPVP